MTSEREEGCGEARAHDSLQDESVHETKVSCSSETKVSERETLRGLTFCGTPC